MPDMLTGIRLTPQHPPSALPTHTVGLQSVNNDAAAQQALIPEQRRLTSAQEQPVPENTPPSSLRRVRFLSLQD